VKRKLHRKRTVPAKADPKDLARAFVAKCWPDGISDEQRREVIKIFLAGMFSGLNQAICHCHTEHDLERLMRTIERQAKDINDAQS
jgi:hypothetical protein